MIAEGVETKAQLDHLRLEAGNTAVLIYFTNTHVHSAAACRHSFNIHVSSVERASFEITVATLLAVQYYLALDTHQRPARIAAYIRLLRARVLSSLFGSFVRVVR